MEGKIERHFHFTKEATYIETQNITVESGANFYNGVQSAEAGESKTMGKDVDELVLKLMPVFMDNEEYAESFLADIKGKDGLSITRTVVKYRETKKLNAQLCHHMLWQILSEEKLYVLSERNWNERIRY